MPTSRSRSEARLREAKNAVRGQRSPQAFSYARACLPASRYPEFIAWLQANTAYAKSAMPVSLPETFAKLHRGPVPDRLSLVKEVRWASSYLSLYGAQLSKFVSLAS